jgi:hypothetical protein
MAFPLGILASSRPIVSASFDHLATITLTSTQSSVSFTNLIATYASAYTHLQIRITSRSNYGQLYDDPAITFNGITSGYWFHGLGGTGTSIFPIGSGGGAAYMDAYFGSVGANAPANAFGSAIVDIPNAFMTNQQKTIKTIGGRHTNGTENRIALTSGLFPNSSAVDSIRIAPVFASFVAGSRFSLYGRKA